MEYIVGVPSVLIFLLSFCLFILELFLGFCVCSWLVRDVLCLWFDRRMCFCLLVLTPGCSSRLCSVYAQHKNLCYETGLFIFLGKNTAQWWTLSLWYIFCDCMWIVSHWSCCLLSSKIQVSESHDIDILMTQTYNHPSSICYASWTRDSCDGLLIQARQLPLVSSVPASSLLRANSEFLVTESVLFKLPSQG